MTDKDLRRDVLDALDFDPSLDAAAIGVVRFGGCRHLDRPCRQLRRAGRGRARGTPVKGVRAVAQEIEVRLPQAKTVMDDQIAARALAIIDWSVHLPTDAIQVRVAKGWITLTGSVPWQYQVAGAEAAVRKLSGVVGVSNLIEVRPEVRPSAVRARSWRPSGATPCSTRMRSRSGSRETASRWRGAVSSLAERDAAERAAWSVPGVRAVHDRTVALT